ncbi:5'-nucleotidase [Marinobacter sp. VGCF2001]|uniref:5'-nucleotidase n=1 Tax=Marinobacter sp. VGCF2001 TaxID=3417189 RepID=UPI003CE96D70
MSLCDVAATRIVRSVLKLLITLCPPSFSVKSNATMRHIWSLWGDAEAMANCVSYGAGNDQRRLKDSTMPYPIEDKLVIAVASSALFDLSNSDHVFRTQGEKAYRK